jgi:DNA-binding Xre family transcriptional regulator
LNELELESLKKLYFKMVLESRELSDQLNIDGHKVNIINPEDREKAKRLDNLERKIK